MDGNQRSSPLGAGRVGNSRKILFLFLALTFITCSASKSSESAVIQDRFLFGQCIHLGQKNNSSYASPSAVEIKMNEVGGNSYRDGPSWDILQAASLQTLPASMHKISYLFHSSSLRPLLVLGGNTDVLKEGQPSTDESRGLYARFAQTSARILSPIHPIFEIWNEWNMGAWNVGKVHGSPETYVQLLKSVYPKIKSVMPNGLVLGGAVGEDPEWAWTLKAVDLGLMEYADGLSVHMYNHCDKRSARTGDEILGRLELLHERLVKKHPGKVISIYVTEFGWPTKDKVCGGVSEDVAAANIAQILLAAPTYPWLKGVWNYELLDEKQAPKDADNREFHFGLFRSDGSLKPSGCLANKVWDFIADQTVIEQREPVPNVKMVVFGKGTERRVALWQTGSLTGRKVYLPDGLKGLSFCGMPAAKAGVGNDIEAMPLLFQGKAEQIERIKIE